MNTLNSLSKKSGAKHCKHLLTIDRHGFGRDSERHRLTVPSLGFNCAAIRARHTATSAFCVTRALRDPGISAGPDHQY
jgi:hypothetical protein